MGENESAGEGVEAKAGRERILNGGIKWVLVSVGNDRRREGNGARAWMMGL